MLDVKPWGGGASCFSSSRPLGEEGGSVPPGEGWPTSCQLYRRPSRVLISGVAPTFRSAHADLKVSATFKLGLYRGTEL